MSSVRFHHQFWISFVNFCDDDVTPGVAEGVQDWPDHLKRSSIRQLLVWPELWKIWGFDHNGQDFWSDQGRSGRTGSAGPAHWIVPFQSELKKNNMKLQSAASVKCRLVRDPWFNNPSRNKIHLDIIIHQEIKIHLEITCTVYSDIVDSIHWEIAIHSRNCDALANVQSTEKLWFWVSLLL